MNQIKKFRAHAGWSQQALADALGITRTAVANYEAGRQPAIAVAQRFVALAREHGMPTTLDDIYSSSAA